MGLNERSGAEGGKRAPSTDTRTFFLGKLAVKNCRKFIIFSQDHGETERKSCSPPVPHCPLVLRAGGKKANTFIPYIYILDLMQQCIYLFALTETTEFENSPASLSVALCAAANIFGPDARTKFTKQVSIVRSLHRCVRAFRCTGWLSSAGNAVWRTGADLKQSCNMIRTGRVDNETEDVTTEGQTLTSFLSLASD